MKEGNHKERSDTGTACKKGILYSWGLRDIFTGIGDKNKDVFLIIRIAF